MKIADPNHGYSSGLDYSYVYGKVMGYWMVWHRWDGEVVDVAPKKFDECLQRYEASKLADQWNQISSWPDAETITAIDATP